MQSKFETPRLIMLQVSQFITIVKKLLEMIYEYIRHKFFLSTRLRKNIFQMRVWSENTNKHGGCCDLVMVMK